ncbi:uncharacterized protein LOC130158342 [Falco biarmicus]|uniref:uncharacterized protein LOC130158342 n=1 Tax=Falco biarmicus TaxID=345155 RepID=UPI0024BD1295|nr:uncharacterized protein LOC130158342 [Falco biarmicus]
MGTGAFGCRGITTPAMRRVYKSASNLSSKRNTSAPFLPVIIPCKINEFQSPRAEPPCGGAGTGPRAALRPFSQAGPPAAPTVPPPAPPTCATSAAAAPARPRWRPQSSVGPLPRGSAGPGGERPAAGSSSREAPPRRGGGGRARAGGSRGTASPPVPPRPAGPPSRGLPARATPARPVSPRAPRTGHGRPAGLCGEAAAGGTGSPAPTEQRPLPSGAVAVPPQTWRMTPCRQAHLGGSGFSLPFSIKPTEILLFI